MAIWMLASSGGCVGVCRLEGRWSKERGLAERRTAERRTALRRVVVVQWLARRRWTEAQGPERVVSEDAAATRCVRPCWLAWVADMLGMAGAQEPSLWLSPSHPAKRSTMRGCLYHLCVTV